MVCQQNEADPVVPMILEIMYATQVSHEGNVQITLLEKIETTSLGQFELFR